MWAGAILMFRPTGLMDWVVSSCFDAPEISQRARIPIAKEFWE